MALGHAGGEIRSQWLDSTKLRGMTGWAPETSLNEGLRAAVEWYRGYALDRRR